jgi:hypothetical protein
MKKRRGDAKKPASLENEFFKMEAALIKDVQGFKKHMRQLFENSNTCRSRSSTRAF